MSFFTGNLGNTGITGGAAGGAAGGAMTAGVAIKYVKTTYYDPLSPIQKRKLHKIVIKSVIVVAADVVLDCIKRCFGMEVLTNAEKRALELIGDLEAEVEQADINIKNAERDQLRAAEEVGYALNTFEKAKIRLRENKKPEKTKKRSERLRLEVANLATKEEVLKLKSADLMKEKELADEVLERLTELKSGKWKGISITQLDIEAIALEVESFAEQLEVDFQNKDQILDKTIDKAEKLIEANSTKEKTNEQIDSLDSLDSIRIHNLDEEKAIEQEGHRIFYHYSNRRNSSEIEESKDPNSALKTSDLLADIEAGEGYRYNPNSAISVRVSNLDEEKEAEQFSYKTLESYLNSYNSSEASEQEFDDVSYLGVLEKWVDVWSI